MGETVRNGDGVEPTRVQCRQLDKNKVYPLEEGKYRQLLSSQHGD